MNIIIVRTCTTSAGEVVCEVPGAGTKDSEPMDLPDREALDLIALGHARLPPNPEAPATKE